MVKNSIAERFPMLVRQWDYEHNGDMTPENTPAGSHKIISWHCPDCGQYYHMKICNRTAPSREATGLRCPVCSGQTIVPGYNSVKALYPDVIAKEWDVEKNLNVNPDTIPPHSNKKYYWRCPYGHSYSASVNNKISGTGGNCPYCSHQRLLPENSLSAICPEVAIDWDFEMNRALTPDTVAAFSNKKVHWVCHICGHKWIAEIDNRSNGRGCPNCSKGHHTSFPEQVIFYYVHQLFPDAKNGETINGFEADIYIPSLMLALEYDGEFYHKAHLRLVNDLRKNRAFSEVGVSLVRFRESKCPVIDDNSCTVVPIVYKSDYSTLQEPLQSLLDKLANENGLSRIEVNVSSIRNQILSEINVLRYEDSLEYHLNLLKETGTPVKALWDYDRNAPLTPNMIGPFSDKEVYWMCPNDSSHKWKKSVHSIMMGCCCPDCSKRKSPSTAEWISKAVAAHGNRYDYSQSEYVDSKTKVAIICAHHGVFQQLPIEHIKSKGCPYCAHQSFHPNESLAAIAPEIADEWDYEKNLSTGKTPKTISSHSSERFWWHCNNGFAHSYLASVSSRVKRHSGCAVCHGKQFSYDRSLEFNHPELSKEWSSKNIKKPSEVTCGLDDKFYWKCPKGHPDYLSSIYSRVHLHSGCPICGRH